MVRYSTLFALALSLGIGEGRKKSGKGASGGQSGQANVIVIMTDDQGVCSLAISRHSRSRTKCFSLDLQLDSLSVQPQIQSLIGGKGTTYNKHYCTTAWCCPSRVSFLTGKAAHNTNVTSISPPYGGYPKFLEQGLNGNYLPIWLSNAGINRYVEVFTTLGARDVVRWIADSLS